MWSKIFLSVLFSLPQGTKDGVKFTYFAPSAKSVYLVGDFNDWNTSQTPMEKDDNGTWSVVLPLKSGKYQYKFFVDGKYEQDPTNPITEGPYGNSVIKIGHDFRVLPPTMSNNTPMNSYVTFHGKAKGFVTINRDTTNSYRLFSIESDVRTNVEVNIKEEAKLSAILHYNTDRGQDPSTHQIPFYFERALLNLDKHSLHFASFYNKLAYKSPDPITIVGDVNEFGYPLGRDEQGVLMRIMQTSYDIHLLYSNEISTGRDLGYLRIAKSLGNLYGALSIYINHGNNIEYQVISPDSETINDSILLHFNTYEDRLLYGFELGEAKGIRYEFIIGKDLKRANYFDEDGSKAKQVPTDRKWDIGKIYKFRSTFNNNGFTAYIDMEHQNFDSLFYNQFGYDYTTLKFGAKLSKKRFDFSVKQNLLLSHNNATKWDALFRGLKVNSTSYIEYPLLGYSHYTLLHIGTHHGFFRKVYLNLQFNTARYAINQPPRTDEVLLKLGVPLGKLRFSYDGRYYHIKSNYLNTDEDFFDHYIEISYTPIENITFKTGYGFYPYNLLDEYTARREYLLNKGITINQLDNNFRGLGGLMEEGEKEIAENKEIRLWLELYF